MKKSPKFGFYTPCIPQFLVSAVHYTLFEAIIGASIVMTYINSIVLYLVLFESLQLELINITQLLLLTILVAITCFISYITLNGIFVTWSQFKEYFRTIITLIFFGYGFTPVIR
jgi:hypothetical protein